MSDIVLRSIDRNCSLLGSTTDWLHHKHNRLCKTIFIDSKLNRSSWQSFLDISAIKQTTTVYKSTQEKPMEVTFYRAMWCVKGEILTGTGKKLWHNIIKATKGHLYLQNDQNLTFGSYFGVKRLTDAENLCQKNLWSGVGQLTVQLDPSKTTDIFTVKIFNLLNVKCFKCLYV